ncbi:hypothetical protein [Paludisphaera soli]|uniref:hypothetical protein n=1 Tax=Paludisphaera soli TaxID=2712865 RepID=UPI0013E9A37B|nr:hypothetical protein [Paludisphaera soli]
MESFLQERFERSLEVFGREIYPQEGEPIVCQLHETFGSFDQGSHNCLGCNFADVTAWINNHLSDFDQFTDVAESMSFYLLKLYLFVERAYEIFDIIQLPEEHRKKHFSAFINVHEWANFIKHPKAFLLVHHPAHFIEGMPVFDASKYSVVIDQEFVKEFYSGADKNGKLYTKLKNKRDVAVLYPDPLGLTESFCEAIHKFVRVLQENEVYREVLASRTTYENYYTQDDSN